MFGIGYCLETKSLVEDLTKDGSLDTGETHGYAIRKNVFDILIEYSKVKSFLDQAQGFSQI